MIEYNFNELDNDFITCWCKYLLTGDSSLIMGDLEKLAKLGQINAIQEWYRFHKKGDNTNIDNMLLTLSNTYNELLIKARVESKDVEQKEEHQRLLAYANEEEWVSGFRTGYYQLTKRAEQSREEIRNISYIDTYYSAVSRAFQIANRTDDVLVMETANEIYWELSGVIGIDDVSNQMDKKIKKVNNEICNAIAKEIKKEKKESAEYDPLNNPRLCFVFAKAVLLFHDNHKHKQLAVKMLKGLASREYSSKLKTTNKR